MKGRNSKAFTLVECVVALALFGFAAIMISQTCFNCLNAVSKLKKDAFADSLTDYLRTKILTNANLSDLQSGLQVYAPDGKNLTITGDAEATEILDLFKLEVYCQEANYRDVFYLIRPAWYDQLKIHSTDRAEMLQDRKDSFEQTRRESIFK